MLFQNAYNVNLLLAGLDKSSVPKLFYMDYLGALVEVPFAIHGYGSYISLSILDRKYRPDMGRDDAIQLVRDCIAEIQKRFVYNLSSFKMKIIDADGMASLPDVKIGA